MKYVGKGPLVYMGEAENGDPIYAVRSLNEVFQSFISKITVTDEWNPIAVEDNSKFKLRNASTVDILVRTDTTSGDDFWTVEPGELFPPGGFGFGLNYQVRVISGSAVAELISGK